MNGERGNASIYADDPTAVMTADRIDALWRVAERHVPDADDVDVRCALLTSFALRHGMTPDRFDEWCAARRHRRHLTPQGG